MTFSEITCNCEGGIGTLILNSPASMNALSRVMSQEIVRAVEGFREDAECRVIVIKGTGRAFSAGGDLKVMQKGLPAAEAEQYVRQIGQAILAVHTLEKPVLAVVGGYALGAGFNLALAADLIIASEEARFGQVFLQIGLTVDGGSSYFLPRLIGLVSAKELVFTGRIIEAAEALSLGLINKVVPKEDLEREAAALSAKLAEGPGYALGMAKKLLNAGLGRDLASILVDEARAQAICMQTGDHREGLAAFQAKRTPQFRVQ